jgi:hypothetical protein
MMRGAIATEEMIKTANNDLSVGEGFRVSMICKGPV